MATPEAIQKAVIALMGAWNRQANPDTFHAFRLALSDITDEHLQRGLLLAIRTGSEHPPSASQLRRCCLGTDTISLRAMAALAYAKALRAAKSKGLEFNPRAFGDYRLSYAIACCGGWPAFCATPISDGYWQRQHFIDGYVEAAASDQMDQAARLIHDAKAVKALGEERQALVNSLRLLNSARSE